MPCTVIHCKYAAGLPADRYVYCGRPSKWGNPHAIGLCSCGTVHSRTEAILLFNQFWNSDDGAMLRVQALQELRDKTLGCWCHPKPCHAQIIADSVNHHAATP